MVSVSIVSYPEDPIGMCKRRHSIYLHLAGLMRAQDATLTTTFDINVWVREVNVDSAGNESHWFCGHCSCSYTLADAGSNGTNFSVQWAWTKYHVPWIENENGVAKSFYDRARHGNDKSNKIRNSTNVTERQNDPCSHLGVRCAIRLRAVTFRTLWNFGGFAPKFLACHPARRHTSFGHCVIQIAWVPPKPHRKMCNDNEQIRILSRCARRTHSSSAHEM